MRPSAFRTPSWIIWPSATRKRHRSWGRSSTRTATGSARVSAAGARVPVLRPRDSLGRGAHRPSVARLSRWRARAERALHLEREPEVPGARADLELIATAEPRVVPLHEEVGVVDAEL